MCVFVYVCYVCLASCVCDSVFLYVCASVSLCVYTSMSCCLCVCVSSCLCIYACVSMFAGQTNKQADRQKDT